VGVLAAADVERKKLNLSETMGSSTRDNGMLLVSRAYRYEHSKFFLGPADPSKVPIVLATVTAAQVTKISAMSTH